MNLMPTFTKDVWGKWDRIPRPPESPVRDSPPPTASRGAEGDGDPAQWLDGCDASGESGRQLPEYHQATPRVRGKSEECHADVLKSTPICRSSLSATAQSHGHASHISCWLDSTIIRSRNCQPPDYPRISLGRILHRRCADEDRSHKAASIHLNAQAGWG